MYPTVAIRPVASSASCSPDTVHCAHCGLHTLCLPTGLNEAELQTLDRIIGHRRRVQRGASLFRMNDPFTRIYAIRFGHFKTFQLNARGEQQINGFQMPGELLGLDAVGSDRHHCGAIALEDSEVCEIPFARLEELFGEIPQLLRHFHRLMGQEITREQNAMLALATMRAEQRMALFLLDLHARRTALGCAGSLLPLPMSRADLGNHLRLATETVSRLLARFRDAGWLRVTRTGVELLDRHALRELGQPLLP